MELLPRNSRVFERLLPSVDCDAQILHGSMLQYTMAERLVRRWPRHNAIARSEGVRREAEGPDLHDNRGVEILQVIVFQTDNVAHGCDSVFDTISVDMLEFCVNLPCPMGRVNRAVGPGP
jgi:hypothetical protein